MEFSGEIYYVTDEERVFFDPMLPKEVRETAELIIGCVLEDGNGEIYPGGVLAASGFDEGFVVIDFLYVPRSERRKGIGRALISHLEAFLMNPELGIDSFQCSYIRNEHTESLDLFLTAMGFEGDSGAEAYGFLLADLKPMPQEDAADKELMIRELGELPAKNFHQLADEVYRRFQSGEETKEVYLPLEDRSYYDPDYSFLYLDETMTCQGGILVSRQTWGYMVEYLCCLRSKGIRTVMALITALLKKGLATKPPYTMIRLSAVLKSGGETLKKFCKTQPIIEGNAVTRVYQA